ncbi:hypothetical protein MLD38_030799 [Melastoma candidum]|uniref:Uncharacterized protein n=1 Tax=Melastoma candidum TaxID=119954 RepID=A0ACB9MMT7_9MYRT|nr:hypothetical protein MLD38_030799 [Melastoma candidum]
MGDDDLERKRIITRAQWLRAAILGASDGLLTTTSLILGICAAQQDRRTMILSGISGALAGAFSGAVGEYVSVSTQRDLEKMMIDKCLDGDDNRKEKDLEMGQSGCETPNSSGNESPARGAPTTHGEWLLKLGTLGGSPRKPHKAGINEAGGFEVDALANPYIAAGASGISFLCGAIVPIMPTLFVPSPEMRVVVFLLAVVASVVLALLGGAGAYLGGSSIRISAIRVLVGGWIAMGVTYCLLKAFDTGS